MLLQFKNGADEEDCPLPEEIRQDLVNFHQDLLAHCGKEKNSESPPPKAFFFAFSPEVSVRFPDLKHPCKGWRDVSAVKSTDCFSREPGFYSQHRHGSSQLCDSSFRISNNFLAVTGTGQTHGALTYIEAKHHTRIIKINK